MVCFSTHSTDNEDHAFTLAQGHSGLSLSHGITVNNIPSDSPAYPGLDDKVHSHPTDMLI